MTQRPSSALPQMLGGAITLGGGLWYGQLMSGVWAAEALGPICGHAGGLALHCPACYVALGSTLLGLTIVAVSGLASPARSANAGARTRGRVG